MNKFLVSTKIYSSINSLDVLKRYQGKKIWVVCDNFIAKSPAYTRLQSLLAPQNDVHLFSDITPDPSIAIVVAGIAQFNTVQPDIVIGFGGGSAIDAAKAIVYFARQQGRGIETCIAIPTTSGTGSEVTSATVISDPEKGIKYPIFEDSIYPDIAILDPSLVVTVPPAITANTGMDVLTHALEAYVSKGASDFTDALAEKAVQLVFQYLPTACVKGDCLQTRSKMHNASAMAGMAFSQAGLGLNHAIAHQLGGQFHIAHGLANSLLLTQVIQYNANHDPRALKRYARMAKICQFSAQGADDKAALHQLLNHIRHLQKQIAIQTALHALKISEKQVRDCLPEIIRAAQADSTLKTNPCPVADHDIARIIEAIL
jgi:1-propanol dehydrogenase